MVGECALKIYLFTDEPQEALSFAQSLERFEVVAISIPSYGWPEATLLRYSIMTQLRGLCSPEEVLVYIDSDMEAVSDIGCELFVDSSNQGISLVQHPGYFRPSSFRLATLYLSHPLLFLTDLVLRTANGAIGTWEKNRRSKAFVQRKARKNYFCGGIWWGLAEQILALCDELAERVDQDTKDGIMASWHDESHLNWWASKSPHLVQPPNYCYSYAFPALSQIQPTIVAVEKSLTTRI
jgi:hypothetical protein